MRFRLSVKMVFGKSRTLIKQAEATISDLRLAYRRDRRATQVFSGRIVREPDRCDLGMDLTGALRISILAPKIVPDSVATQ